MSKSSKVSNRGTKPMPEAYDHIYDLNMPLTDIVSLATVFQGMSLGRHMHSDGREEYILFETSW